MTTLPNRTEADYWQNSRDSAATFFGFGTTSARYQLGTTANQRAMAGFFETHATTGDTRGMDIRLHFSGTGGSGEAFRAFGVVNGVTAATGGTVNGAHISLSVNGAAGAISGAGNALRATLGFGDGCNPGGTVSALQVDSDFHNGSTVASTVAAIRITNSNTKVWPMLMEVPNPANDTIFATHTGTDELITHSLRFRAANGTPYYMLCSNSATGRGSG